MCFGPVEKKHTSHCEKVVTYMFCLLHQSSIDYFKTKNEGKVEEADDKIFSIPPFSNLPDVEKVTVNIYKEADKKKKKEKNLLLGYINIPVEDIAQRHLVEKWYTAASVVVGKAGKEKKEELPLVRIKARYQRVNILPMDQYAQLIKVGT